MKDTYRYKVLRDGVVISKGFTKDFKKMATYIKSSMPDATIKRVGGKVTFREAEQWLEQAMSKAVEIASIPTVNYKEVIEVRVPTRFYWNEDGSFDGIEFGEFKTTLLPWQEDMVRRCLESISLAIECKEG